ncbi:Mitochondrial carrier protein [Rasamsonia emersonii CBS 393.64]|uniref:Mitochondrial carrier protein n=1 Tax=Rasamsonia emersonii (strain ATCC 16479 / CBS 393.64 / IMI 116815) TaxID=1408163 RepID=A0A0F4Z549_RASE3|nr:Mitochondrial carrier protein [Rasamsonia emersonii CBS 393.64]KKA25206.1 Mitochondrial carrier protein [Rasamsonia emersonii CBS 393.64]
MLSATWGSLLTSLLVTPLDVVRVRLQSQTNAAHQPSRFTAHTTRTFKALPADLGVTACCREVFWVGNNAEMCLVGGNGSASRGSSILVDCAVEHTRQRTFTSTLDALQKIARYEGPLTLWRGLSPTLLMAIPANVIYFTGYDWLRSDPRSPIRKIIGDAYVPLVAGAAARIAAASVISPIEMFRTRLQATPGTGTDHFRATLRGLHEMTQAQGYSSLWRGLTLTMWRDVPFSGLYWWGYEQIRNALTDLRERAHRGQGAVEPRRSRRASQSHQNSTSTFIDSFVAGSLSGAAAAFVTTPFDVGKTRQQVFRQSGDTVSKAGPVRDAGAVGRSELRPEQLPMPKFLFHIFRTEGLSGLFRGWVARCLKVAPACAIMISSYEIGKKLAQGVNERRQTETEGDRV